MHLGRTLLAGAAVLALLGAAVWLFGTDTDAPAPAPDVPATPAPSGERAPRRQPVAPARPAPLSTGIDGPTAATSPSELLVRVLAAESGEPIEGAEVAINFEYPPVSTSLTDPRGEVLAREIIAGGLVIVRVRAPGRVQREGWVTVIGGENASIELRLERGVALEGTVVDHRSGRALQGARVVAARGGSRGGRFEMDFGKPYGSAETDAQGKFRIDGIRAKSTVTVTAVAAGHSESAKTVVLYYAAVPPHVELRLRAAAVLRGVVRYPDGRPASGARVYAVPADAPDLLLANPNSTTSSGGRTIRALRGAAGDGGDYEVSGLDIGAVYSVLAVLDPFGRSEVERDVSPTEADPQPLVDLVLRPYPTLTVRVAGPDGESLSEAVLFVFGEGFPVTLEQGKRGVFFADVPGPGKYTLRVTCPGWVVQEIAVEIAPSEQKELDVLLERGLVLAGVLVDDLGEPVPGQKIWVDRPWQEAGKHPPSSSRTETDAEGRFRFEGLRGGPHSLGLVLGRHHVSENLRLHAPDDDLRVTITRSGAVRALLALPAGTAAPDKVGVRIARGADGSESGHSLEWNGGDLEQGRVPPGPCRVRFQVAGLMEAVRDVTVKPGETLDLGRITMVRGLDLEGLVQDRSGRPVVGAEVAAGLVWTPTHRVVTSDRDGRFTLSGFASGENDLEVIADGFLPQDVVVALPVATVPFVVTLDAGCKVTVRVTHPDGRPAPAARIRWIRVVEGEDPERGHDGDEADHGGVLALRLRAGRWRIEWVDDDWEPLTSRVVELTEGGAVDVELTVPR